MRAPSSYRSLVRTLASRLPIITGEQGSSDTKFFQYPNRSLPAVFAQSIRCPRYYDAQLAQFNLFCVICLQLNAAVSFMQVNWSANVRRHGLNRHVQALVVLSARPSRSEGRCPAPVQLFVPHVTSVGLTKGYAEL